MVAIEKPITLRTDDAAVYDVGILIDKPFWYPSNTETTNVLLVCYELLVAECKVYINELDVDEYMEWYELKYAADDKNLQLAVREQATELLSIFRRTNSHNDDDDDDDNSSGGSGKIFVNFRATFNEIESLLSSIAISRDERKEGRGETDSGDEDTIQSRISSLVSNGTLILDSEAMNSIINGDVSLNQDEMKKLLSSVIRRITECHQDQAIENYQLLGQITLLILKHLSCNRVFQVFNDNSCKENRDSVKLDLLIVVDIAGIINGITPFTDDNRDCENIEFTNKMKVRMSISFFVAILRHLIIYVIYCNLTKREVKESGHNSK